MRIVVNPGSFTSHQGDNNKNLFSSLKSSPIRDDFDSLTRELLDIYSSQVNKNPDTSLTKEINEVFV